MSLGKRKTVGGTEYDAFSEWRHRILWKRGERAEAKRMANRRERRQQTWRMDDPQRGYWYGED